MFRQKPEKNLIIQKGSEGRLDIKMSLLTENQEMKLGIYVSIDIVFNFKSTHVAVYRFF